MPTRFNLPHIDIAAFRAAQPYTAPSSNVSSSPRERAEHGRRLQRELAAALNMAMSVGSDEQGAPEQAGRFVEVQLRRGTPPDKLDMSRRGVRSGAAKDDADNSRSVVLFIPDEASAAFEQILSDYLDVNTERGNPRHKAKVEAIEAFRAARLERFWTDDPTELPADSQEELWWGLWCFKDSAEQVRAACEGLELRVASEDRWMKFPEIIVVPVYAKRSAIELILFATGGVSELRRANDNPTFFTDEVRGDQHPWVDNLAERIRWPGTEAPAVCVIDTGVARAHALIEPVLAPTDMHAIDNRWGTDDHDREGHGTSMAGLSLHGDLTAALSDNSTRDLTFRLESVKILPPSGFSPADLRSYGPFTQAAISLPEIAQPDRSRTFCLALTNENVSGAVPSAWSAAIDQAAAGSMVGDGDEAPKRLIVLACGNIPAEVQFARLQAQDNYVVEDPAQAWNALTVGACTDLTDVQDSGYLDWKAIAPAGGLSPHSRTSAQWPGPSPFKPEVVIEGGNRAVSPSGTEILTFESLSLLSAGKNQTQPLVAFQGTSAAAAQVARIAARIAADHPEFWPEMIRALLIHSAEWTPEMLRVLDGCSGKRERCLQLRRFGFGVPSHERATASASNDLALFAQAEIQPFHLDGGRRFNECHYYTLPIPRAMLDNLENEIVDLKVTLSYFIDPNPGLGANVDPQRYRSHGLRFDLRRPGEPLDRFKQRVNAAELAEGEDRASAHPDDARWMFGGRSISAGSLHCDVWTGPAIELSGRDTICIKPVNGWSRSRSTREVCNKRRRYALIVSLRVRNIEFDIYTPINTQISLPVEIRS